MDWNKLMTPYPVSEWEWFCLRLQIYAISEKSEHYAVYFNVENPEEVVCRIYCEHTAQLLEMGASTDEQLEYYQQWVEKEKQIMRDLLSPLPVLNHEFNPKLHVVYQIMHVEDDDHIICEFSANQITWQ